MNAQAHESGQNGHVQNGHEQVDRGQSAVEILVLDGRPGLVLRGDLDLVALPAVREALLRASADPRSDLVIDFRHVTFCGAAVLGLLAATSARLRARGYRLRVCRARPVQARVFQLCALEELLVRPAG